MTIAVDKEGAVVGQVLYGYPGEERQGLIRILTKDGGKWVLASSVRLEELR